MSNADIQTILDHMNGVEERINQRIDGIESDIVSLRFFMQGLATSVKNLEDRINDLGIEVAGK